jgi:hypothetical protein
MEPVTMIATALALGAAAGLKPTAEQAVKDAYAALKALIKSKYPKVSVGHLEEAPESKARRSVLEEDLTSVQAAADRDVLQRAKDVMEAVQRHAPAAAAAVGVDLDDIRAAAIELEDIVAQGTGVKLRKADVTGAISIKKVRAGGGTDPNS